ncbi:PCI domain-containing protein [Xylaria bambusicola]|uniref:PCI domain-containing protein n=1 Tax=Xylaria bambusicola TaxID=326684 RepID=UPI00200855AD|nr:PCI domain-containing protein [Xylaria bambusicola]KAI0509054.1 PCI domain-containing protein [Xylaria bambusicola]
MEQTKALNALEPFLALSKSATGPRAAADLITQATSNSNTYVFAELLQTPQIQALAQSPDYASHLKLLEIFSYGTYADYTSTTNLPLLNDAQILKLRQLSLLTLAKDPHNLSYAALQQSLSLPDSRAVENLIISAIYAGLVDAQLDPRNGLVRTSSVSPLRDLAPGSIPSMLNTLREWSGRCTSTLEDLEVQIASMKAAAAKRHADKKALIEQTAKLIEEEKNAEQGLHTQRQGAILNRALTRMQGQRFNKRGSGSLEANAIDDEAMEVDEEEPDDGEGGGSAGAALGGPGKKRANRRKL